MAKRIGERLAVARSAAGLTQRELAARAGVPQSTVARIESGVLDPRVGTVEKLLRACDKELAVVDRPGRGVDRTLIRERLSMTPRERLDAAVAAANAVAPVRGALKE